jgi:8-oxo-dGTP pyrophosphatase MutT (NUDIX family)
MVETEDRLQRLFSALFPPETAVENLPVDGFKPRAPVWRPRLAAVLIPLVMEPKPALILTVRSHALKSHAGQVAFPGGGRDADEAFPLATALREAEEEVGIDPDAVKVMGLTRCFDTITAYRIVPVVGVVNGAMRLQPCPREVLTIFRLPLAEALDRHAYRRHQVRHRQRHYELWSMRSACWPVWGATAAILSHIAELADCAHPAGS